MQRLLFIASLISCLTFSTVKAQDNVPAVIAKPDSEAKDLLGRWNLDVMHGDAVLPSWLEVEQSGFRTLIGRYVATSGSARPISQVHFDNGKFNFTIPPQWENGNENFVVEGQLTTNGIAGTVKSSDGTVYNFTGTKAPHLKRHGDPIWGIPVSLFNGKDLTGWVPMGENNQWTVKDGVLKSDKSGVNLKSEDTFEDFKLEIEFRYPEGSNSGIYLRGRYELQITDNRQDEVPNSHTFGGIYGFLTPSEIPTLGPNQWQRYEITLVGRMITVIANGRTIIYNQEIPGITGGAIDSHEDKPGPIYFQGDHGPIEFRNIVITKAY